jgi:ribosome-associated protein
MHVEAIKQAAVEALEEIKATDITVLDVRQMTSLFDYMIVASAGSTRQTKALANNVQDKLRQIGARVLGVEGEQTGEWVLVELFGPATVSSWFEATDSAASRSQRFYRVGVVP